MHNVLHKKMYSLKWFVQMCNRCTYRTEQQCTHLWKTRLGRMLCRLQIPTTDRTGDLLSTVKRMLTQHTTAQTYKRQSPIWEKGINTGEERTGKPRQCKNKGESQRSNEVQGNHKTYFRIHIVKGKYCILALNSPWCFWTMWVRFKLC